MPIYEYECDSCSTRFEMRRGFDNGGEAECPACRARACRVFSPVPVIFKGPGFYLTDSRKNGSTPAEPKADAAS